jgi:hypothetical protein
MGARISGDAPTTPRYLEAAEASSPDFKDVVV